jgi:hypothetical protein
LESRPLLVRDHRAERGGVVRAAVDHPMGDVMTDSISRGYRGIEEIKARMTPLMEWTKQFKPEQQHLCLQRKDYDLIKRWPKAAHCHEIEVLSTGEIWWRGLELVYDSGMGRYAKPRVPQQVETQT